MRSSITRRILPIISGRELHAWPRLLVLLLSITLAPGLVGAQEPAETAGFGDGTSHETASPAVEPTSETGEQPEAASAEGSDLRPEQRLVVVWTSGDRDVALKMVFMYTFNAKRLGWWDDVTLLIWGPSAQLLSNDQELQEYVGRMKELGVHLEACKACADEYGVAEKLEALGVTVRYTGQALTDYLKEGRHVITF